MIDKSAHSFNPSTSGLNIIPFAIMAAGWLSPMIMFWLYVWGPMRPFDYPSGNFLPELWFGVVIIACIVLWWLIPASYFRVFNFEKSGKVYQFFGAKLFRQFVPDGDLANRWERRKNPAHRMIQNKNSIEAFIVRTEQSERGHIVLLVIGIATAWYAWSIGWQGWALFLSAGNIIVNIYPILLQRYTRSRLYSVLNRFRS